MTNGRTDGRTDGRTNNPEAICPSNFFEVGGIIKPAACIADKARKKNTCVSGEKKIGSVGRKIFSFFFFFLFLIDVISKNSSYFLLCYKYIMYNNCFNTLLHHF